MKTRRTLSALMLVLTLITGFIAGQVSAAQPHMQSALNHLRAAKRSLDKATDDKGGHRVKAIALVNSAMAEVEKGIAFDRRR